MEQVINFHYNFHSLTKHIVFLKTCCSLELSPHLPRHVAPSAAARVAGALEVWNQWDGGLR